MIRKIAITGGMATGKSTLLHLISKCGFKTLSCDEIVKKLYSKKEVQQEILKLGGEDLFDKEKKTLSKEKILRKITEDQNFKNKLEAFIHPLVWKEIESFFKVAESKKERVIFVEVPLLFEVGWEKYFDEVWLITASPETQKKRIREREYSEFLLKLLRTQYPLEEKIKKARHLFSSEESLEELEKKLKTILKAYQ